MVNLVVAMKKPINLYPNMTISDPDGSLRAAAAEINEFISGMSDYAGGVRIAIMRTRDQLRQERALAESHRKAQEKAR